MSIDNTFRKKTILKIVVIALLLILNINLLKGTIVSLYKELTRNSNYSIARMCDSHVNDGNYNTLREYLLLYDSSDKMFDSYWEITNAYQYLLDYKVWYKASEMTDEKSEAYEILMNENKEKLLTVIENSGFEKNKSILENFFEEIKDN